MNEFWRQLKRYFKQWWRREPHLIVGDPENPYMRRWWIIPRNPILNVYLHQFLRDDDDSALHDHPAVSLSLLLKGRLREIVQVPQPCCRFNLTQGPPRIHAGTSVAGNLPTGEFWRFMKDLDRITATAVSVNRGNDYGNHTCYRVEEYKAGSIVYRTAVHTHRLELFDNAPAWTLFITGPRVREWGFSCPRGWVHWRQFILGENPNSDGGVNVAGGCPE